MRSRDIETGYISVEEGYTSLSYRYLSDEHWKLFSRNTNKGMINECWTWVFDHQPLVF